MSDLPRLLQLGPLGVNVEIELLRLLTPLLRPAFRWNHNWAIARAIDGLEPYTRSAARDAHPRDVSAVVRGP